jgi:hypothetical protein
MKNKPVYVEFNYIQGMTGHSYLHNRILCGLENNGIHTVDKKSEADIVMDVFCTSLGTNNSYCGANTPPIPTVFGSIPSMKLFGVNLYRGITEYYFFLYDKSGKILMKSNVVEGKTKSDQYNLFFFKLHVKSY